MWIKGPIAITVMLLHLSWCVLVVGMFIVGIGLLVVGVDALAEYAGMNEPHTACIEARHGTTICGKAARY